MKYFHLDRKYFVFVSLLAVVSFLSLVEERTALSFSVTHSNPVVLWNEFVIQILQNGSLAPPENSKILASLHTSIYDSLLTVRNDKLNNYSIPSVIAGASETVLNHFLPDSREQVSLFKDMEVSKQKEIYSAKAINQSLSFGNALGLETINYLENDEPGMVSNISRIFDQCTWNGTNPVLPQAGNWKTIILKSGSEVKPKPPYQCNSQEDLKDIQETYRFTQSLTPQQIAAIHYWGDESPPIIWNNILNGYILDKDLDVFGSALIAAFLNAGIYDAFVSCWDTKYTYWTARPFERIGNLTTVIPTPNFPSYTSGHTVISTTASKILGFQFPEDQKYFKDLSTEASMSRLWAGIHFKQDISSGIEQGLLIGEKVTEAMQKPLHRIISEG